MGEVNGLHRRLAALVFCVLLLASCGRSSEARLRATLAGQTSGMVQLPEGVVEITGRAEGAIFDGYIIRRLEPKGDSVQHPLLLKRVPAPGDAAPDEQ